MPKNCLFCENIANSKEHVIAMRVLKRMGREKSELRCGQLSSQTGINIRNAIKAHTFSTRVVCTHCNQGWMSKMEEWFEDRLGFLIEKDWPPGNNPINGFLRSDGEKLARWMIKTAIVYEKQAIGTLNPIVPIQVRSMTRFENLSDDVRVLAARIGQSDFTARICKGLPLRFSEIDHARLIGKGGFSFALQLNHLALFLTKFPGTQLQILAKETGHLGSILAPFYVYPLRNYPKLTTSFFPDFNCFLSSVRIAFS